MSYLRVVKVIRTESRKMIARGLGVMENWELLFNGFRVSILQDEKSYRVDGGNSCITM